MLAPRRRKRQKHTAAMIDENQDGGDATKRVKPWNETVLPHR